MMKREVKIGLFAVAMIGCAWAGIRFLSGIDIFSRSNVYYAAYDQISGVQTASPVMIRGVKVGTVTEIRFDPTLSDKVIVQLTVKRQIPVPKDSEARIVSGSIMGAKTIDIELGHESVCLESGDTLRSSRNRDLMDVAGSELDFFKQRVAMLTDDISRTLGNINTLLETNAAHLNGTISHIDGITGNVDLLLAAEREDLERAVRNLANFTQTLNDNGERLDSIMGHMNTLTAQLSDREFTENLTGAVEQLNLILTGIHEGEGTVGSLMNDEALYRSLAEASANLSTLLADLQEHPGRYVHFSLFGRSEAKEQERARKLADKEAKRAERDSIRAARQAAD